jgi:glycosyltransferase involved in cell wall biosynthesis
MHVTVAICSWNRARRLVQTLDSLTALAVPDGVDWELLVVNNNCTDDTDRVVASFTDRLPLRLLHEPTPGLSCARNRAVQHAAGEYILWTDDDVVVDSAWLTSYHRAFLSETDSRD